MSGVSIEVQGVEIVVVFLHVLDLEDSGVIFGNAWLISIGRVLVDYGTMTMEFQINGKKYAWLVTTSIKARKGDGPISRIEELEIWSEDKELPMMQVVYEEEKANNFGVSKEATDAREESIELLTLIHAEGVLEIQPVMTMGGMKGQLDIETTLGLMRMKVGGANNEDLVHREDQGGRQR